MIASADTLGERLEHTPIWPSIDVVPRDIEVSTIEEVPFVVEVSIDEVYGVVSEFLGDNNTQQINEVPGDIAPVDDVPGGREVSTIVLMRHPGPRPSLRTATTYN